MDNDTLVESFKYLNYRDLASNCHVSKRFCNLIRTHRHKFALLYVDHISMRSAPFIPAEIKIFGKELSPEEYNEWVIRNKYSKQIPIESEVVGEQSAQCDRICYQLIAETVYTDANNPQSFFSQEFFARIELSQEYWPVFQHYIRLITDPFICIRYMSFRNQLDVLNLLTGAISSDHSRLQCKELTFRLTPNYQALLSWFKNHIRCEEFLVKCDTNELNYDAEFFEFFTTGANCTSKISVKQNQLSKSVMNTVRKFLDLKSSDECQIVESIRGNVSQQRAIGWTRSCAQFIATRKEDDGWHNFSDFFEFVNNEIGKKLRLATKHHTFHPSNFWIVITDL